MDASKFTRVESWLHQSHQSRSDVFFANCYQASFLYHDPFYKAKHPNIVPGTGIKTDEELALLRPDS